MMDATAASPRKKRRHSKACLRCRKRKIRCDFQFPCCGACSAAGATCLGYNSIQGVEQPRSTISHLENEVARLEVELRRVKDQSRTPSEIAKTAIERLTTRLAVAIVQPENSTPKQDTFLPLSSSYFISSSPIPYLNSVAWNERAPESTKEAPGHGISVFTIPRHVLDIMLNNYCETYRPQYPAIEESELHSAFERVYSSSQPSSFDFFCVYITLAISTNTLIRYDEKKSTTASMEFWATAMSHLDLIDPENPWERLQALQLLTHYAFTNPDRIDCSKCAEVASRLCSQLGLHRELPDSADLEIDDSLLDARRRLFWNTYSIDSAVHTVQCRPFLWPITALTTKFPDASTSSPSSHIWALRQIETEITITLYYPSLDSENLFLHDDLNQWFERMENQIAVWHQTTRQSVSLSEKIEFYELHYHFQTLRLNRRSPRCPNPSERMRKTALKSSITLIKEYGIIERLGKLFNLWHAAHCIIEAGVCLLASALVGIESTGQSSIRLGGEDVTILIKYIKAFPCLLHQIARRWPSITEYALSLDAISSSTLEKIQQWSSGNTVSDIFILKQRLTQFSAFSPFTTDEQRTSVYSIPAHLFDNHNTDLSIYGLQTQKDMNASTELETSFGASHFDMTSMSAPAPDPAGPEGSSAKETLFHPTWDDHAQYNPSIFSDSNSISSSSHHALEWGFSEMDSEAIFAALFENEDLPLLDDYNDALV